MAEGSNLYVSLPNVQERFDVSDPERSAQSILPLIVPHAKDPRVSGQVLEVVSGGQTNKIWKVSFVVREDADRKYFPPVLVRVFGAEGMIDREIETSRFVRLWQAGVAPSYYGRFVNGRVEGFLKGCRTLTVSDLGKKEVSLKIAVETARLHKAVESTGAPELWEQMEAWLRQARGSQFEAGSSEAKLFAEIDLDWIARELDLLKGRVTSDFPVVFCHNDLLAGNIMENEETGTIHLIDFEYGGSNYRGFDIANHFNEWAGGTEASNTTAFADYTLFPSEAQMLQFCKTYLAEMGQTAAEDVEQLLREVEVLLQINHLYWGLWAINMAASEGCAAFPYLNYAHNRIAEFRRRQQEGPQSR